jgi:hypothetical protein
MSGNLRARHLDQELLLKYADGELPPRKIKQAREHLEACWQCRAELEELQSLISECVRYRKNLQISYPSPTAPWGDIYRGFAKIDASRNDVPHFVRFFRALRAPSRWVPATLALATLGLAVFELRHTPSVEAAELLRKAVAVADAAPQKVRRIQIRTNRNARTLTRTIGASQPAAVVNSSDRAGLSSVETLFENANYSWTDPLSAKSYQSWHDQLASRRDEVADIDNPGSSEESLYRVRTVSDAGPLKVASIELRKRDLQPVGERFEFRNADWVEITEIPESLPPTSVELPAAVGVTRPSVLSGEPASNPASFRDPEATLGNELQVLAALHRIGADLGDPIEVTREQGHLLVSGVGIESKRQRQVQEALSGSPNVRIRFSEPAVGPSRTSLEGSTNNSSGMEALPLRSRMEKQVGGHQNFEQLSAHVLDASDTLMSRVYALRRLAERFPRQAELQLSPEDRQLLSQLNHEHAVVLARQSREMEQLLTGVLSPLGGMANTSTGVALSSELWQSSAEEIFASARRVETLVAVMLGVTPSARESAGAAAMDASSVELPSQVLTALARLRTISESYERLTAQTSAVK